MVTPSPPFLVFSYRPPKFFCYKIFPNFPPCLYTLRMQRVCMDCTHDKKTITRHYAINGRLIYYHQCPSCGWSDTKSVSYKHVRKNYNVNNIPLYDKKFYEKFCREENQRKKKEWWALYNEYLTTPEWHDLRIKIINRDKNLCQECFSKKANEVHHLHYRNVFKEKLEDLISVCKDCHNKIHFYKSRGPHGSR